MPCLFAVETNTVVKITTFHTLQQKKRVDQAVEYLRKFHNNLAASSISFTIKALI